MPSRSTYLSTGYWRTILVVPLLVGLACVGVAQVSPVTAAKPGAQPEPSSAGDPLKTLNGAFRTAYYRAKQAALARSGPVILVEGDDLVLKRGDQRVEAHSTAGEYHVLKAIAHVPLALDVMVASRAGGEPMDEELLNELRKYRGLIEAVAATIAAQGLDAEQVERQRKLIAACESFLDSVVAARRCTRADRLAFTRRMTPLVMSNAAEAARAELDSLHRQVSAWRSQMTPEEWKRLSVVILGSAAPRKGSLTVQYFARLLGEPGEGARIVYAESIRDESKALDLMATRAVDTGIGVDFFNDPLRMHRDLLADVARDYLPLLVDRPD
jgi:hypothetical protein